jgi:hypothetical protein
MGVLIALPFWLESRCNAREAHDLAAKARVLADRIREEEGSSDDADPEMIFHIVSGTGETREIEIFLDQRMLGDLSRGESSAWQGLIEFVEDDIDPLP